MQKCEEAIKGHAEYVNAFIEFDAALPAASTEVWTARCQAWEKDRSQPNPFSKQKSGNSAVVFGIPTSVDRVFLVISDANIRLRLAQEDTAAIQRGDKELVHENISPSMLIYQGLEFEDFQ